MTQDNEATRMMKVDSRAGVGHPPYGSDDW